MIRNIVVPIDLSESSLNALNTAIAIAKTHHATIQILHIEENVIDYVDEASAFFTNSISNSPDILAALASTIYYTHSIKPEIILEKGNVLDTIISRSLTLSADLIVMGTHGASGYRDGFMGTNSYSVIKYAPCPVLCIPVKKKILSFKKVLFPIRPVTRGLVLYDTVRCFTGPNAVLEVLGLSYKTVERDTNILNTIVEEIRDQLEKDQVQAKVVWGEKGIITDDILLLAQQQNPDLLVITAAIDGTSKSKFVGPYTQKVVNTAKLPILCIKNVHVPSFAL